MDVEALLEACRPGTAETYRTLESLLVALNDPATRLSATRSLHALVDRVQRGERAGFSVTDLRLPAGEGSLRLVQLPSVFAPENWSYTFYEGLSRLPRAYFHGRMVAELGCGNGWITLALARRCLPSKVYGLDINPRAVLSAKINLHLAASAPDGTLILDAEGRSLLDRCVFATSDLLAYCRDRSVTLDRVTGCIPQVLDPDLEGSLEILPESASDEFLYSLSNYCSKQGYVEDQFGLGLMARVLEEAIERMVPSGRVVFNMGGRPGQAVLERLFGRRGFRVRELWQTRARQADDTDIQTLVEIEKRTRHRFEFFMGPHAEEPVSARTAAAYAAAGGEIAHAIRVYEGELAFANQVKAVFDLLRDPTFGPVAGALDLAFEDGRTAEEKTSFLADLAELLRSEGCFPYGDTRGVAYLRERLVEYLQAYFRVPLSPDAVVVTPTRASAVANLLTLHRPPTILVDHALAGLVDEAQVARWEGEVLEGPGRVELTCQLISTLRPQLVVTALAPFETRTTDSFAHLVETAARTESLLVIDMSADFELSSSPRPHALLRAMAEARLPDHVITLCGLVKNEVYRDLELCFLLSENAERVRDLELMAELTYSRAPLLTQRYYARILADLLSFRLEGARAPSSPRMPATPVRDPGPAVAAAARAAFAHPSMMAHSLPLGPDVVRLDYGENALPAPSVVRVSLFEAFARQNLSPDETDPRPEIATLLRRRFGLSADRARIHVAGGVAPLFAALMRACAGEAKALVVPAGSYGYFTQAARLHGVEVREIETKHQNAFKLTAGELGEALVQTDQPWVFLNGPVVNPTGAIYRWAEMEELIRVAQAARATVIVDTIFAGLEAPGEETTWSLDDVFRKLEGRASELAVLGGISKELAAGGLRFGWGWAGSPRLSDMLAAAVVDGAPHATIGFAAKRMLGGLVNPAEDTRTALFEQRRRLAERRSRLASVLEDCGWEPLLSRAGLFLVARPTFYEDKTLEVDVDGTTRTLRLDGDQLVEALFRTTGVLINGPTWTGVARYFRFVVAVPDDVFEAALQGLRRFRAMWP